MIWKIHHYTSLKVYCVIKIYLELRLMGAEENSSPLEYTKQGIAELLQIKHHAVS